MHQTGIFQDRDFWGWSPITIMGISVCGLRYRSADKRIQIRKFYWYKPMDCSLHVCAPNTDFKFAIFNDTILFYSCYFIIISYILRISSPQDPITQPCPVSSQRWIWISLIWDHQPITIDGSWIGAFLAAVLQKLQNSALCSDVVACSRMLW